MRLEQDLTAQPIAQSLIRMSVPLILSNLLQALYGAVDMALVGYYVGDGAISAVGISGQVILFLTVIGTGLANGSSVVVAYVKGKTMDKEQPRVIGTVQTMFLLFGVSAALFILFFSRTLLTLLHTPDAVLEQAVLYLIICAVGMMFVFGYNGLLSIFRALGNTMIPLCMMLVSTAINLLLDILLMGRFGLGCAGAALATVTAQMVACIAAFFCLRKFGRGIVPRTWGDYRIAPEYACLMLKTGIPSAIQSAIVLLSMLVVTTLVNGHGVVASAAYGIGVKIDNFSIMARQAVAGSAAAMIAQNAGAGNNGRIRRIVWSGAGIALATGILAVAVVQLFPEQIISLFHPSQAVAEECVTYLRIVSVNYLFSALMGAFNALPIGIGFTRFAMVNSFVDSIVTRLGLCLLFEYVMKCELKGIYWALGLAPAVAALIGFGYFRSGRWRRRKKLL